MNEELGNKYSSVVNSTHNLESKDSTDNLIDPNDESHITTKKARIKHNLKLNVTNNAKNNNMQFMRRFIMDNIVE